MVLTAVPATTLVGGCIVMMAPVFLSKPGD